MTTAGERFAPAAAVRIEEIIGENAGRKFHDNIGDNANRELGYLSDNACDANFVFTMKQSDFKTVAAPESAARSADRSKGNR